MTNPLLIAPSILSCDFARIGEELARAEAAGADWHHVDVMDGHFVPNLTIGPPVVSAIHKVAKAPLDVHLMITEPLRYAADYAKAGAHVLTFHIETCVGTASTSETAAARAVIAGFRSAGITQVGVSLKPDTSLERILPLLDLLDLVLVMSVFPGFGGQKFMPEVLSKTRGLREHHFRGRIEMDGGINSETIARCAEAGCDTFVMGSALFGARDMRTELARCRDLALKAAPRALPAR